MSEFKSLKLPEAVEMGRKLRLVSQEKSLIEHFYPLLIRGWAGKTVVFPEGLVTLFREALNYYEKGATEEERSKVVGLLPLFVSMMVQGQDIPSELEDDIVREVLAEHQPS